MKPMARFVRALLLVGSALAACVPAPRSSGSNNRFEFPTTGASADGNALLLAIDDLLLPLRYNLCYYLTRPEIHPEPVLTPSRENPTAPDSERRLQTVRCLRNGLGKRLSGRAPYPGRPELVISERPEAAGAKKPGFNCSPSGAPVYTPTVREPETEIPAKIPLD